MTRNIQIAIVKYNMLQRRMFSDKDTICTGSGSTRYPPAIVIMVVYRIHGGRILHYARKGATSIAKIAKQKVLLPTAHIWSVLDTEVNE
jgi:hypothetical protein